MICLRNDCCFLFFQKLGGEGRSRRLLLLAHSPKWGVLAQRPGGEKPQWQFFPCIPQTRDWKEWSCCCCSPQWAGESIYPARVWGAGEKGAATDWNVCTVHCLGKIYTCGNFPEFLEMNACLYAVAVSTYHSLYLGKLIQLLTDIIINLFWFFCPSYFFHFFLLILLSFFFRLFAPEGLVTICRQTSRVLLPNQHFCPQYQLQR